MKKLSLLIIIAIAFSTVSSYAQEIRLGIKGGPNFSNVNSDLDTDSRTGYHFGAFGTIKLSKLAIQPELIFSNQGSILNEDGEDLKVNYSYLNIPVIFKLYLLAGLNLQVGPQFGFLSGAEREQLTGGDEDIKDELKNSDISLGLGAGWDLPFGLTLDARYNLGLSDVNDAQASGEIKNQVFQVSVGYRLFEFGN